MKKRIITMLGIIGICVFACIILSINIYYSDTHTPPTTYIIHINKLTKNMFISKKESCSYVGCKPTTNNIFLKLTSEEYLLVNKILKKYGHNKDNYICSALSNIAHKNEIMYKKGDIYYEKKVDNNNDGIITMREFGYNYLISIYDK